MTSTLEELNTINNSLNNIKTSLINKDITPTGNITTYATAINNYTIPIGINREVNANGVYGRPTTSFTFSLPSNATNLGNYALSLAFQDCTGLTNIDLSSLTTVSGDYALNNAFYGCTALTSVDLSSLTTVSGGSALSAAFYESSGLTSVDLSSLTTVSGDYALNNAFYGCTALTSVDLSSLTTVSGSYALSAAFYFCSLLQSLSFPSLTSTSFGSYTNQFNYMLSGVTGCTVHFPSNLQSVIGSWSSVTSGFGGTNTTVLFDLTATT